MAMTREDLLKKAEESTRENPLSKDLMKDYGLWVIDPTNSDNRTFGDMEEYLERLAALRALTHPHIIRMVVATSKGTMRVKAVVLDEINKETKKITTKLVIADDYTKDITGTKLNIAKAVKDTNELVELNATGATGNPFNVDSLNLKAWQEFKGNLTLNDVTTLKNAGIINEANELIAPHTLAKAKQTLGK